MAKLQVHLILLLYLAVTLASPVQKKRAAAKQDTRQPIYLPGRCPPHEMLYPGAQLDQWECDCAPGFLHYPPNNKCYEMYKQGPCKKKEYFIIEDNKQQAECVSNPCSEDGSVPFKGACATLYASKPCPPANSGRVLRVNVSTLQLACVEGGSQLHIIDVPDSCPRGSRRNSAGQCRRQFPVAD